MNADGSVTESARLEVLERVQSMYPPELLNRLDDQIVFNSLSRESVVNIVNLRLKELEQVLNSSSTERRISLVVEPEARDWLAAQGYSPQWGARLINRLINKNIREPLSMALLQGTIRNGDVARIRLDKSGKGIELVPVHEAELQ